MHLHREERRLGRAAVGHARAPSRASDQLEHALVEALAVDGANLVVAEHNRDSALRGGLGDDVDRGRLELDEVELGRARLERGEVGAKLRPATEVAGDVDDFRAVLPPEVLAQARVRRRAAPSRSTRPCVR